MALQERNKNYQKLFLIGYKYEQKKDQLRIIHTEMTISFLKIDSEESLKILRDVANSGFELHDKLEAERMAVAQVTGIEIDRWNKLNTSWIIENMHKLEKVLQPQELFGYKKPKSDGLYRSGENAQYQNILKSIESRAMYIKELADRIMFQSNIYVNAKGDAFVQAGNNNTQET